MFSVCAWRPVWGGMFENRALRKIFWPKGGEFKGKLEKTA